MRSLPEDLEVGVLIDSLAEGWGFDTATVEYAAVGGGSYHWIVTDNAGERGFVNVDDLDRKPWLGDTRDSVFDGLRRAFDTAVALRDSGLEFVVAPLRTGRGETVRRLTSRYSIALFPYVEGQSGRFGSYEPAERTAILAMLAGLHEATPAVASLVRRIDLGISGRHDLEAALDDLDTTWDAGPFSEPARRLLVEHASAVTDRLARVDGLAAKVAKTGDDWVVTHGEPHAGNVLLTDAGYVLVDWDTVALGPRERDLWMLVDDSPTDRDVDLGAVSLFRLTWNLADVAAFLDVLRSPHGESDDSAHAYESLTSCLTAHLPG